MADPIENNKNHRSTLVILDKQFQNNLSFRNISKVEI